MTIRPILLMLAALVGGPAYAQASYSPEDFAVVEQGEKVSFDSQSVRKLGELTRFEISIRARKADERPAGSAALRQVRYVAKCAAGEMALASVFLIDDNGRVLKNMVVPPGGGDYEKPAAGSQEAAWIAKACD